MPPHGGGMEINMKVSAVITEYNPFHFGHKYQLSKMRELSDAVMVIMSGPFVQRGDAAVTDKWTRAKSALENGADLVVELPVIYALNSAREFADGAVSVLERTHAVDILCFGSECGDTELLAKSAHLLENEPPEVSAKIKRLIGSGASYPSARAEAFKGYIPAELLSKPNDILALEYIRSLMRRSSSITPHAIKRIGAGYHDTVIQPFASATGIRKKIFEGDDISELLPGSDFDVYDLSALDYAVIARLRCMSARELADINGVSEGMENRILNAALECSSISELAEAVKTKRYTMTRIRRVLLCALLNITKELAHSPAKYLRVLGMTAAGAEILRTIKQNSELTIITKTADYSEKDPVFAADIRAQDIFSLCGKNKKGNADYTTSPVIVK